MNTRTTSSFYLSQLCSCSCCSLQFSLASARQSFQPVHHQPLHSTAALLMGPSHLRFLLNLTRLVQACELPFASPLLDALSASSSTLVERGVSWGMVGSRKKGYPFSSMDAFIPGPLLPLLKTPTFPHLSLVSCCLQSPLIVFTVAFIWIQVRSLRGYSYIL